MKDHARPFVENWAEATTACLVTMVQGNLLVLSLSHWWIASQTGLLAGAATTAAIAAVRARRPWLISVLLGVATSVADYFMHTGTFGPFFLEAIVTGAGAAVLSWLVQSLARRNRTSAAP